MEIVLLLLPLPPTYLRVYWSLVYLPLPSQMLKLVDYTAEPIAKTYTEPRRPYIVRSRFVLFLCGPGTVHLPIFLSLVQKVFLQRRMHHALRQIMKFINQWCRDPRLSSVVFVLFDVLTKTNPNSQHATNAH